MATPQQPAPATSYVNLVLTRPQQMALVSVLGDALRKRCIQTYVDVSTGTETTVGQLMILAMDAPRIDPSERDAQALEALSRNAAYIMALEVELEKHVPREQFPRV